MDKKRPSGVVPFTQQNLNIANATEATKIRHHNKFNETLREMPHSARRVLFLMMAQYDSKAGFGDDVVFRISADDYANLCGIAKVTAYAQLKSAAFELMQQVLVVPKEDLLPFVARGVEGIRSVMKGEKPKGAGGRMFHFSEYVDYSDGSGYIEVAPSRQLEPYIANLLNVSHTSQSLLAAVRFSDRNTSNMYQFIRESYCSPGKDKFVDIAIDDLKDRLGLFTTRYTTKTYSYPDYPIFKRNVINRTLKIINKDTEMAVTCKVIKKDGRKAHTLRFTYSVGDIRQPDLF